MTPTIDVRDLAKTYVTTKRRGGVVQALRSIFRPETQEIRAVAGVSFSVAEGELVGFLGPNGAGKTTTLKMLAGLLHPTSGEARVLGHVPWQREDAYRRRIALVMGQKNQLWWDLPAMDSLALNREIYGVPKERFTSTVDELTELLGVAHRLTVQVRELSLGERMKFELIASLLHEPRVLFLDEPTIGLDVTSQQRVREFLRAYNESRRTTILLTSHNMQDIKGLASRVLLINHGRMMFDGPLPRLVERSAEAKHLKVTASRTLTPSQLTGYGELVRLDGAEANLKVPRDKVAAITAALLASLPVVDLTIEDPPIEEVISDVFESGAAR